MARVVRRAAAVHDTGRGSIVLEVGGARVTVAVGFDVLYVAAQDLFKQLRAARADGSHDRRMLRFTTPDLLLDRRSRPPSVAR
jgi:DNA replication protein DnaC